MELSYLGTDYGGWLVDLSLVPRGSTVVAAGVGEDISFDRALIEQKKCHIVGIDPTVKSHQFIEKQEQLLNFTLLKNALHTTDGELVTMYKNKNPHHVSESILPNHGSVMDYDYYYAATISLDTLFSQYDDISLIKMDIEGSEYDVLKGLTHVPASVKQLCIEFHHFCSSYTIDDTQTIIESIKKLGFEECYPKKEGSLAEITLIRRG